jgi:RNA polymerase sigma-70 factor, ECF subfamily
MNGRIRSALLANEKEFIARAQQGDSKAFDALAQEYLPFVYNLAFRVVGQEQEAEDLSQEAFVRAWTALPRFRSEARFSTWMYRIVTNLCYNRLPSLRRELATVSDEEITTVASPTQEPVHARLEAEELRSWVHRQVDELPEKYRLLVSLYYQEGQTYEEIATVTSLPLGTVKTGLFRAKEQLRRMMTEEMKP